MLFPELDSNKLSSLGINSFIIDCELLPLLNTINNMTDGTEIVADTQLNLVTSILGSLDELSHKMQETNPLKLVAFDLIMYNGSWLTEIPLSNRDRYLDNLLKILSVCGIGNRIEKVQSAYNNKESFYNKILALGR